MGYFVLIYDLVPDYMERRAPFTQPHMDWIKRAGNIIFAGAYGSPPNGACYVFEAGAAEVVKAIALGDPYVTGGIVASWRIEPWFTIFGPAK